LDTLSAVPQSLAVPGELAAAIASRSEHRSPPVVSSLVVFTLSVAAAALAAQTHANSNAVASATAQTRGRERPSPKRSPPDRAALPQANDRTKAIDAATA
jgi:hypothetical protein